MKQNLFFIILNIFVIFLTSCNFFEVNNKKFFLNKTNNLVKKNNIFYFSSNKYNLSYMKIKILQNYADYLIYHPKAKILIEGHTDEIGSSEYNISLGEKRCHIIKFYLQLQGVNSNQIIIRSYGKELPKKLGHKEEIYKKNRRVILKLFTNTNN